MGFLKEKSGYRPTRMETVLAWVFTAGAGAWLGWQVLSAWLGRG